MPANPSELQCDEIQQRSFAAARALAGLGVALVGLHIGADHCSVAIGTGAQPDEVKWLALGTERTAREHFKTTPPTPLAMENAIQLVEDVVMPLNAWLPRDALLFSADAAVLEIGRLSGMGVDSPQSLSLEAIERCFNRLVAVVQGSPATQQGLPASNSLAAALLILREFMHHLHFTRIVVLNGV